MVKTITWPILPNNLEKITSLTSSSLSNFLIGHCSFQYLLTTSCCKGVSTFKIISNMLKLVPNLVSLGCSNSKPNFFYQMISKKNWFQWWLMLHFAKVFLCSSTIESTQENIPISSSTSQAYVLYLMWKKSLLHSFPSLFANRSIVCYNFNNMVTTCPQLHQ